MVIGVARLAGVVWVAYFGLAVAGDALKILPLSLAANAVYFAVAVVLWRFLAAVDPLFAFTLLPLAAAGCVIQSIGMIQSGRDIRRLALVFFGLFLVVLGYLLLRAGAAPQLLGYALVAAGVLWCTVMIPGVPALMTGLTFAFGAIAEGALALWLLLNPS